MLIFVVLAQILGTELILGAFLAGVVVSMLRTPADENLTTQLEAIGFGFFIPIFFIKVGLDFNLQLLLGSPQSLVLVPILLAAALLVKFLPAWSSACPFPGEKQSPPGPSFQPAFR